MKLISPLMMVITLLALTRRAMANVSCSNQDPWATAEIKALIHDYCPTDDGITSYNDLAQRYADNLTKALMQRSPKDYAGTCCLDPAEYTSVGHGWTRLIEAQLQDGYVTRYLDCYKLDAAQRAKASCNGITTYCSLK